MLMEVKRMSVGSRLKEARIRSGKTQAELAREVGVTTSAIGNYETGVSTPREGAFIALMNALGMDANFFYQDDVPPANAQIIPLDEIPGVLPVREDERRLLKAYRAAEEPARVIAMETLVNHPKK